MNERSVAIVRRGGLQCLIQDIGRPGVQFHGLASGGAMDRHAHGWANRLLGNPADCATLEITLGPVELEFTATTTVSLTGADLKVELNHRPVSPWQSVRVQAGDHLSGHYARNGLRAYLGVHGGWQTPRRFGSRSGVPRENPDAPVQTDDDLPFSVPDNPILTRRVPSVWQRHYQNDRIDLDLLTGYQHEVFSTSAWATLMQSGFTLSPDSDRMGARLRGPALGSPPGPWRSEGIAAGTVQVPPDGQPIVMLRDRQTIGGYPKPGCLTHAACNRLAQCRPGETVHFRITTRQQAVAERLAFYRFFGF